MNMPVVQQAATNLPAHLQDFGVAMSIGASAMGGIQVGQSHPRISIRQNRFRLLDEQGQEALVNALYLDVIVVGANDHVSKLYYAKAFDPADPEPPAPTCYSDNGVAPSDRAQTPQALTCSQCPYAAWGSKVTPSGTKVKACSDSKKLAVILADNPTGAVYELRVPAASMENLKAVADQFEKRGEPLPSIVLRLTFDAQSSYPKLIFQPVQYITAEQKAAILEVIGGEEVADATSKNDKPRDPNQPLLAQQPQPQQVAVPPVAQTAPAMPQPVMQPVPQPMMPPGPQFAAQPPQAPVMQQPQPQFVPQPQPATAAPAAPRKRRTKAQIAAEAASGATQVAMAATPQFTQPVAVQEMRMPAVPPGLPPGMAPNPVAPQFVAAQPVSMPQMQPAPAPQPVAGAPGMPPMPDFLRRDMPNAQAPAASVPLQPQPTDAALDGILGNAMVR